MMRLPIGGDGVKVAFLNRIRGPIDHSESLCIGDQQAVGAVANKFAISSMQFEVGEVLEAFKEGEEPPKSRISWLDRVDARTRR